MLFNSTNGVSGSFLSTVLKDSLYCISSLDRELFFIARLRFFYSFFSSKTGMKVGWTRPRQLPTLDSKLLFILERPDVFL